MSQRGFTLLEMALVITVVGILIGGGLLAVGPLIDKTNVTKTNTTMDQVENALELFVIRNPRLPCPADGSLPANNANYGLEQPQGGGACTVAATNSVIPWRTLGIDESYSIDAWGNRLSYYASQAGAAGATTSATSGNPALTHSGNSYPIGTFMTVTNVSSTTQPVTPPPANSSDQAAYVLISHGKSGWYGWGKNGVQHVASYAGGAKGCNNNPATCAVVANSYFTGNWTGSYPPSSNTYFDDILRWRSAAFIIQMCGTLSCGN